MEMPQNGTESSRPTASSFQQTDASTSTCICGYLERRQEVARRPVNRREIAIRTIAPITATINVSILKPLTMS